MAFKFNANRYKYPFEYVKLEPKKQPNNETYEHFICKCASQIIAYNMNCRHVATEVYLGYSNKTVENDTHVFKSKKNIDCIGITKRQDKVVGFEAKASLNDFRNGFCLQTPYLYIICPKEVIPIEQVPKNIGLIYVDVENFKFVKDMVAPTGCEIVKTARKRFEVKDDMIELWVKEISITNTIANVFRPYRIPVYRMKLKGED